LLLLSLRATATDAFRFTRSVPSRSSCAFSSELVDDLRVRETRRKGDQLVELEEEEEQREEGERKEEKEGGKANLESSSGRIGTARGKERG